MHILTVIILLNFDDLINTEVYYQIGLVYKANENSKIPEKFLEISRIFTK